MQVIQNYLALITMLYHHNKLQKSHLTRIYSILSKKFYEKQLNSDLLYYTFRLLRSILSIQSAKTDYPANFFYFTGIQSSIKVLNTQPTFWPFISVNARMYSIKTICRDLHFVCGFIWRARTKLFTQ
jgi:hypothetical protein